MAYHCRCNNNEKDCSYPDCHNGKYDNNKKSKEALATKPTHLDKLTAALEDVDALIVAGRKSIIWKAKKEAMDSVRSACTALFANPTSLGCAELSQAAHELDKIISLENFLNDRD